MNNGSEVTEHGVRTIRTVAFTVKSIILWTYKVPTEKWRYNYTPLDNAVSYFVIETDDLSPEAYSATNASLNFTQYIVISLGSLCLRLSAAFTLHDPENKLMTLCLPFEYSPIILIFHFPSSKNLDFSRLSRVHSIFIYPSGTQLGVIVPLRDI